MGNLGWDHHLPSMVGSKCYLSGKRWEEPGLVSLGKGGWRALRATWVPQVTPGKGGRGTHLWAHLGAAGQGGTTGVIPIPHLSYHCHKCRKWP